MREFPSAGSARRNHVVVHGDESAVAIETGLDLLVGERPRKIHRHVVFAGIDHLDRLADGFRRLNRRNHHVRVEPPAEAAAKPHLMHHDVFRIDAGGAGRNRARARRELVAGIQMPDVALELAVAFMGSIGQWMLMLVVYSASNTFAAVPNAAAVSPSLTKNWPEVSDACSRLASSIRVWLETLA